MAEPPVPPTTTSMSLESIQKAADEKGMALVDDSQSQDDVEGKFEDVCIEADRLSQIVDPPEKPYESKYKANEILDKYRRDFLARKLVSFTGGKKSDYKLSGRFTALLDYRMAKNHMETEEPQSAEPRLAECIEFFFPELVEKCYAIKEAEEEEEEDKKKDGAPTFEDVTEGDDPFRTDVPLFKFDFSKWKDGGAKLEELPHNSCPLRDTSLMQYGNEIIDALNHMGLLWCNRSQINRAFCFLAAARAMYTKVIESRKSGKFTANPSMRKQTESLHTMTLFYLAQLYGHLGQVDESCECCHKTLDRQLFPGFEKSGELDMAEWTKNCLALAHYYGNVAQDKHQQAAYCLRAAEYVIGAAFEQLSDEAKKDMDDPVVTGKANVNKQIAQLFSRVLAQASNEKDVLAQLMQADVGTREQYLAQMRALMEKTVAEQVAEIVPFAVIDKALQEQQSELTDPKNLEAVAVAMGGFDTARAVFRRANNCLGLAKAHFVLDGFVTEHVQLLQETSQLYKNLAVFETDGKRRLAMMQKRVDMLTPLLTELNVKVYESTHQQVAFELGETYGEMTEQKSSMIEAKLEKDPNYKVKAVEVKKVNAFIASGCQQFQYFLKFFNDGKTGELKPMEDDDESLRPFLLAHFHLARLLGKTTGDISYSVAMMTQSLKKFEYVIAEAQRSGAHKKDEVFRQEYQVCKQMVELLPEKINHAHYKGKMLK